MKRLVALAWLVGCGFAADDLQTVPDEPTYTTDIAPLFVQHCNLCHGARPSRGAPHDFRLDVYDDLDGVEGARTVGWRALQEVETDEMPPAAEWGDGLGPNGAATLRRWIEQGSRRQ